MLGFFRLISILALAVALVGCGDDDSATDAETDTDTDTDTDSDTDADTDSDADTDADTDTDTDTDSDADCPDDCMTGTYSACSCGAADPCGWGGDGYCDGLCVEADVVAEMFDDSADCTGPCSGLCFPEDASGTAAYVACNCDPADPCGWAENDVCDSACATVVGITDWFDDSVDCDGGADTDTDTDADGGMDAGE
jgi:hypothetical protein